ncbi:MAG: hypothetical protein QF805_26865 [Pirellulaceae bacterium]|nr:hypothetical protein [Pirellulaceae bacterium]
MACRSRVSRDPRTRQSADHSMLYIIATLLRKAFERQECGWCELMLNIDDYCDDALFHPDTRRWMEKIDVLHGGDEFDRRYPAGIPTAVEIHHSLRGVLASGLVEFPLGHSGNQVGQFHKVLQFKMNQLLSRGVDHGADVLNRMLTIERACPADIAALYQFPIANVTDE